MHGRREKRREGRMDRRRKGGRGGREDGWREGHYLIPFICDPKVVSLQTAVATDGGREGGELPLGGCEVPVL